MKKSSREFVEYMWKIYPLDSQLPEREGMLKAWKFLSGEFDAEEHERLLIAKQIKNRIRVINK